MSRSFLAAAWLLAWAATPGFGQAATAADTADILILDHDFGALGEQVRLFLQDKQVYRAEVSSEDVTLLIRARARGMPQARVYPISNELSPSGGSTFEIYPNRDGEYEIIGGNPARFPALQPGPDLSGCRRVAAADGAGEPAGMGARSRSGGRLAQRVRTQ